MLYTYLGVIAFFVLNIIAGNMTANLDARWIGALIDPFGNSALGELTRYWSSDDMNTRLPTLTSLLLVNRAIWLASAILLLLGAFRLFRSDREGLRLFRRKAALAQSSVAPVVAAGSSAHRNAGRAPAKRRGRTVATVSAPGALRPARRRDGRTFPRDARCSVCS